LIFVYILLIILVNRNATELIKQTDSSTSLSVMRFQKCMVHRQSANAIPWIVDEGHERVC